MFALFDTPFLGQFLSDFVRVKSNVSYRPSTLTYPREIFDRATPLTFHYPSKFREFFSDPLKFVLKISHPVKNVQIDCSILRFEK